MKVYAIILVRWGSYGPYADTKYIQAENFDNAVEDSHKVVAEIDLEQKTKEHQLTPVYIKSIIEKFELKEVNNHEHK